LSAGTVAAAARIGEDRHVSRVIASLTVLAAVGLPAVGLAGDSGDAAFAPFCWPAFSRLRR
jgi:hypothetical protein